MKYRAGETLTLRGAINSVMSGRFIIDGDGDLIRFSDEDGFQFQHKRSKDEWAPGPLAGPFYEAIPEPEYNLTFMEAYNVTKDYKVRVEREDGEKFFQYCGKFKACCGDYSMADSKIIDAKYRVIEGA